MLVSAHDHGLLCYVLNHSSSAVLATSGELWLQPSSKDAELPGTRTSLKNQAIIDVFRRHPIRVKI